MNVEGSRIHLTWSKSRYPSLKDLIDQLAASAPQELPKPKNGKARKSAKPSGSSRPTAQS